MGSTLTLLNVRTSVREHIDEPTAGYWTDAELNDYISKAELALWRKIYALKKDYWLSPTGFTLSTVVGKYKYGRTTVIQDLTFTDLSAGQPQTTIAYTTGGVAGSEAVTVVGNAISVKIASGVSTASQILAAVNGAVAAAALVSVAVSGTGSNAQTAPVAATLVGGLPLDIFRISAIRTITSGQQDIIWQYCDPTSPIFIDGLRSDTPIVYPYCILYALRNINSLWISPLPQTVLQAQVDYIQQPVPMVLDTDTFLIPDSFLTWVEYKVTARALRKGPVGDYESWDGDAKNEWDEIVMALDTPRTDQGPDVVEGFQEQWN